MGKTSVTEGIRGERHAAAGNEETSSMTDKKRKDMGGRKRDIKSGQ